MTIAKTVAIHAKCSDCCTTKLLDGNGDTLVERDGYVPSFMPGRHHGDYIILDIELNTGKILNWVQPTSEQIEKWKEQS